MRTGLEPSRRFQNKKASENSHFPLSGSLTRAGGNAFDSSKSRFLITIAMMIIVIIMSAFLVGIGTASAKTLSEIDDDIRSQQEVVDQSQLALESAQSKLDSMQVWYYKNTVKKASFDSNSLMPDAQAVPAVQGDDSNLVSNSLNDVIVASIYMGKAYDDYRAKQSEVSQAVQSANDSIAQLNQQRKEKERRIEALAKAHDIQFCQGRSEPWGSLPYWNGTVSSSGCGLCAYTVAIDVLTGESYTPADMLGLRGDWRGMDGYPDDSTGTKDGLSHHDWTFKSFDIETYNVSPDLSSVKEAFENDAEVVAMVCASGSSFKNKSGTWRYSGGHFITITGYDDEGFHVSDSAYSPSEGTDVIYSDDEMARMLRGSNHVTIFAN